MRAVQYGEWRKSRALLYMEKIKRIMGSPFSGRNCAAARVYSELTGPKRLQSTEQSAHPVL